MSGNAVRQFPWCWAVAQAGLSVSIPGQQSLSSASAYSTNSQLQMLAPSPEMSQTDDLTADKVIDLLRGVENLFPHITLGGDKWYLVAISALVAIEPCHTATLYSYLISKPQYATSISRQALVRRLREALVKNISVLGVCKPIESIFAISEIERPEDKDYTFTREHWTTGPENRKRGEDWLNTIYKENLTTATASFAAHRDFDFISKEITYGFYLSDHSVLGPVETELVVLSGIMIQNLPRLTAWHLRGLRRLGVSTNDVELIQQCIELLASQGDVRLQNTPRVSDVEHEV